MKRNPGATAQTKKNLVEAFWTLYCDKKMEHISVKEITAKAGYNRSTFYEYFTDITDLLNKIEDSLFSKNLSVNSGILSSVSKGEGQ